MKVVQINISCQSGSTGKICAAVGELLTQRQVENHVLYNNDSCEMDNAVKYTDAKSIKLSALSSRVFGNWGFEGKASTHRLLALLDKIEPDIIHLHNLHSHACNLELLFSWIKRHNIKVFWTMHDCWAFTGYCMHYDMIGCDKWRTGCGKCPQKKNYSWFFDRSASLYEKKKQLTRHLDLTLIAPSQWTAEQTRKSFLSNYPVKVIYNGIDLNVFRPVESDIRSRYRLENKRVVLGVAFGWDRRKGLDVFVRLAGSLGDSYRVVLVGTNDTVDAGLPGNICSIYRTTNQEELAALYTAADVFVNPTREEVLGLTNIEALACGTPVITFDTGGSPETIDETCGAVVPKDDVAALTDEIRRVCETAPYSSQACRSRALLFDGREKFREYCELYFQTV